VSLFYHTYHHLRVWLNDHKVRLFYRTQKESSNMQSIPHAQHLRHRISWSSCSECRADCERRFSQSQPFRYAYVHDYLSWIRPKLAAIREGETSPNSQIWLRDFRKALHRRISSRDGNDGRGNGRNGRNGRKWADSYLERLQGMLFKGSPADAPYLREFANRGASCLDYGFKGREFPN
jgi:hypothetical protein